MTTQWKRAIHFAEYAEALGVDTRAVLAVFEVGEGVGVYYTPDVDEQIWSVILARDTDGILRVVREPREEVGLWDQLKDSLR